MEMTEIDLNFSEQFHTVNLSFRKLHIIYDIFFFFFFLIVHQVVVFYSYSFCGLLIETSTNIQGICSGTPIKSSTAVDLQGGVLCANFFHLKWKERNRITKTKTEKAMLEEIPRNCCLLRRKEV